MRDPNLLNSQTKTERSRLSLSIDALEFKNQQKFLVDDEAVRPDSSVSHSEDDVVIGSMDYPPTSNNPGNFDAHDEIFQIGNNTNSVADVSVSQVHLEERKEAQIIKLNLRSNTLPPAASIPAGVSSKGRGRLQGSVAIGVRGMDSESRPETQNSDRTVVNTG